MNRFLLTLGLLVPTLANAQTIIPLENPCATFTGSTVPAGWTITAQSPDCAVAGDVQIGSLTPTEGINAYRFASTGSATRHERAATTVTGLTVGQVCEVSFDVAATSGAVGALAGEFMWRINSSDPFSRIAIGPDVAPTWQTVSFPFTATAATQYVEIGSSDMVSGYLAIDNAQIACSGTTPPTVPTSQLQSTAAINTYRFTREHVAARLDATQQQTGTYLQQFAGDARDGSGARWTTLNISQISGNGADGMFAAGTAAWDLSEGDNSLIGALVGAEYGSYDVGADSVEKLGVSGGVYGGVKLGGSALLEGHLTYTYFQNEIASAGASVTVPSQRLLAHVSLSAGLGEAGGLAINPYLEADYAQESIDGYNLGGTAVSSATVTTGLASLGVEITTPWNVDRGQFYGKLQADQAFGNDPAQTNEDVTGTVGLGWFSNTSYDSIGRIELNASGLGGDGIQETRLEGHWERNF